jgi:hypothetical protein
MHADHTGDRRCGREGRGPLECGMRSEVDHNEAASVLIGPCPTTGRTSGRRSRSAKPREDEFGFKAIPFEVQAKPSPGASANAKRSMR